MRLKIFSKRSGVVWVLILCLLAVKPNSLSVGQERSVPHQDSVKVSVWAVNDCIENGLLVKIQGEQIRTMNRNAEKDEKSIETWKLVSKVEAGVIGALLIVLMVRR